MQFDTFLFGRIEVRDDSVITFPDGLPAFEHCRRFTLVHEQSGNEPVTFTLQSLDDPAIAFQIADPTTYGFHYEFALSDAESARLQVADPSDIVVMLVLFRRDDQEGKPIEANFRSPLLINTRARVGMQKIIQQFTPKITLTELSQPLG